MIKINNLTISYKEPVLKNITFTLKPSTLTCILGRNGSGKTTFLYTLYGIIPHEIKAKVEGTVTCFSKQPKDFKDKFFVFQDPDIELIGESVFDDVMINAKSKESAENAVRMMNVENLRSRDPFTLSHGEKQRVLLASALATESKLLVLDEPASLDYASAVELFRTLRGIKKGRIIIVATHDTHLAYKYADEVVILERKRALIGKSNLKKAERFGLRPLKL